MGASLALLSAMAASSTTATTAAGTAAALGSTAATTAGTTAAAAAATGASTTAQLAAAGSLASAAGGIASSVMGSNAQNKAQDLQQAQIANQARRDRLKVIRESRIKAAQIESAGANTGTSGSSGVVGGMGSVGSQAGANVQNINANMEYSQNIGSQNVRAANAQTAGSIFGALGGISGQVFKDAGGYKTIFGDGG